MSDRCSSHASATATCKQSRPKQGEGKDQASDTYKWLPCTWKYPAFPAQSSFPEVRGSIPHWSRAQQPGSSASPVSKTVDNEWRLWGKVWQMNRQLKGVGYTITPHTDTILQIEISALLRNIFRKKSCHAIRNRSYIYAQDSQNRTDWHKHRQLKVLTNVNVQIL